MQASDAHVVAACTVAGSPRASIANARRAMCERLRLGNSRRLSAARAVLFRKRSARELPACENCVAVQAKAAN